MMSPESAKLTQAIWTKHHVGDFFVPVPRSRQPMPDTRLLMWAGLEHRQRGHGLVQARWCLQHVEDVRRTVDAVAPLLSHLGDDARTFQTVDGSLGRRERYF